MLVTLRDVERLLPICTYRSQRVHADLNGLLFAAYLLASIHPNSDDFDI